MTATVDVPVYDGRGAATGRSVVVPDPPPGTVDGLELQVVRELRRFGCGCYWEEQHVYAPPGAVARAEGGSGST